MKSCLLVLLFTFVPLVSGFVTARPNTLKSTIRWSSKRASLSEIMRTQSSRTRRCTQTTTPTAAEQDHPPPIRPFLSDMSLLIPSSAVVMVLATTAFPADAIAAVAAPLAPLPSALWAYAHYLSILVITGCLTAERLLVRPNMPVQDEDWIVKLDLVYGLMAALLIVSGFARATNYGQGGDYYIHEGLFWLKMTVSGIWGGLSLFPSLTFYKRNYARQQNEQVVPPLSTKLANRLQQIINAEISAILSIPILATLMARGVGYNADFPYQVGLVVSIAATGGSFFLYAKQALTWNEDDEEGGADEGVDDK